MTERLAHLEQTYSQLSSRALDVAVRNQQAAAPSNVGTNSASPSSPSRRDFAPNNEPSSILQPSDIVSGPDGQQSSEELRTQAGGANSTPSASTTHDAVYLQNMVPTPPPSNDQSHAPANNGYRSPENAQRDAASHRAAPNTLNTLDVIQEIRLNNGAKCRGPIDLFFHHLNPLNPIVNENQFRRCFDEVVFGESCYLPDHDREQFVTLVSLICAEVDVLHGFCTDHGVTMGWRDFCIADQLLGKTLTLGRSNLLTVQCLVLKARYMLYLGNLNQAYDTIMVAVRTSFQLGLNDQLTWHSRNLSEFDKVMSQRVFWGVVVLEQAIAQSCGLPYLIRHNTFVVDLPPAMDDRSLFPGRPLPQETPHSSFIPYLVALIDWAEVCKKTWDQALCASFKKTVDPQAIASLDIAVSSLFDRHPSLWEGDVGERRVTGPERTEPYVRRQRALFRLVRRASPFFTEANFFVESKQPEAPHSAGKRGETNHACSHVRRGHRHRLRLRLYYQSLANELVRSDRSLLFIHLSDGNYQHPCPYRQSSRNSYA